MTMAKKVMRLFLSVLLLLSLFFPVFATETEETSLPEPVITRLYISNPEALLNLAENCRLDSYSQNLAVILLCDMDLTGIDFPGIPIFCGTFDGGGHTISGLSITCDGSNLGLFRYLTDTAVVKDLTVSGTVNPRGSRSIVGGIVGENAGTIQSCSFRGSICGSDKAGAIAGINKVTGIIETCRTEGLVQGDHFIGGIAGENMGVIRSCINMADVNITSQQNRVELSDITLENITGSESANTVTDIGGIAGTSGGIIRDCDNFADIGYRQMGYNIGGIAGSQMGYLADCQNFGSIAGRKEVGGIVGQMEPVTNIVFTTDTLQILQGQLDTMGALAGRASSNLQSGGDAINGQVNALRENTETAKDAVETLLPGGSTDLDSIIAAKNALASSVSGMQSNVQSISSTAQTTIATLSNDMRSLTGQINAMSATLRNAPENLGGSVVDISDNDTPEDITGKVAACTNYGTVLADFNVGGIAGAISPENDLDPEDDLDITGEVSLNFDSELRAVVLDCTNNACVTITKQNGGGIAGRMALGLVKDCVNTGSVEGGSAEYVGGITGQSIGFLRRNSTKCFVSGSNYVGGIAGIADTVTDCRTMVQLSGTEKVGAVLGFSENRQGISGNYYLTLAADPGAIDGVSYADCAQKLATATFLALEELPSIFHSVTVTFAFEDGSKTQVTLDPGQPLTQAEIPELPERSGYTAAWEGLDTMDVSFDRVYQAVYTPFETVLQSADTWKDGSPLLLAQGSFPPEQVVQLTAAPQPPQAEKRQTVTDVLGVSLPQSITPISLRCLNTSDKAVDTVLLLSSSGQWQAVSFREAGRYLVFDVSADTVGVALIHTAPIPWLMIALAAAAVLMLCIALPILLKRKSAKT